MEPIWKFTLIAIIAFQLVACGTATPVPTPSAQETTPIPMPAVEGSTPVATRPNPGTAPTLIPVVTRSDPGATPTPTPSPAELATGLTVADQVAIYQAVIRKLGRLDPGTGQVASKRTLYIIRTTLSPVGDPALHEQSPVEISKSVQSGVVAALADAPVDIVWVDRFDQAQLGKNGYVLDQGVVITLGNLYMPSSDKVFVPAATSSGPMTINGSTLVVEKQAGVWTITGTTGFAWMS